MAIKQIMLAKKIESKRSLLTTVETDLDQIKQRSVDVERAIEEAATDEEIEAVEKTVEEIEQELADKEAEKEKIEQEIADLQAELDEANENEPKADVERGGKKDMKKRSKEELAEIRSGINKFVHSKGAVREGFTSVEGEALVPEELLTPEKTPEDAVDLRKYVKVIPVNSASGKYPVISKSGSKMHTVAELEANPKLANPTIIPVNYDIETRRGYIPLSQEIIDDADYDVTGLISDEIEDQSLNTSNADIAAVLKTAPKKDVVGVDGLKSLINKGIKKVYAVRFIVSSSLFDILDQLKDKNGRYLLQDSITAESGKKLLGKDIVVLDDDMIGEKDGDAVGFVGDSVAFAKFFDRKKVSLAWVDNQIYGKLLAGVIRYDVKAADTKAGYYISFTAETPETPAGE